MTVGKRMSWLLIFGLALPLTSGSAAWCQVGAIGPGGVAIEGVYVDSQKVLRTVTGRDKSGRLGRLRRQAAGAAARPGTSVAAPSRLRKVSLVRLARAIQQRLGQGLGISDEMRFLAGLVQIQHLFVYPREHDLVIAGPAEGWQLRPGGQVLGRTSGRPVLRLDDLVVAMRIFHPERSELPDVGCSIDPTEEGLERMQSFLASLGRPRDRRIANRALLEAVRQRLGLHTVRLIGLPPDTHLAMVMIEADYRMKLIGIGLEPSRVRGLVSYTAMLRPGASSPRQLLRWWFVPDYEAITESADGRAFGFQGRRVKLLGVTDFLLATGQVQRRQRADPLTRRFAYAFTQHYGDLARVKPVYAELQNAFDIILVAALIRQRELYAGMLPALRVFYESSGYEPEPEPTPRYAESAINYRWLGNRLVLPIGGGVLMRAGQTLQASVRERAGGRGGSAQAAGAEPRPGTPPPNVWWWD